MIKNYLFYCGAEDDGVILKIHLLRMLVRFEIIKYIEERIDWVGDITLSISYHDHQKSST